MDKEQTMLSSCKYIEDLDLAIGKIIFTEDADFDPKLDPIVSRAIRMSLAKYIILSSKESIITKPKNEEYSNCLLFSEIESLVSKIATVNPDGTVEIDGIKFKDGNNLVATIRNKIAHGDYVYSDNIEKIIFKNEGKEFSVDVGAFVKFTIDMFYKKYEYKNSPEYQKTFRSVIGADYRDSFTASDDQIMKILDSYVEYHFDIISEDGNIPKEAYEEISKVKAKMFKTAKYYRDCPQDEIIQRVEKELMHIIEHFNECFSKDNIYLSYDKITLTTKQKEDIFKVFKGIKGNKVTCLDLYDDLVNYVARTLDMEYNKLLCLKRCAEFLAIYELDYRYRIDPEHFQDDEVYRMKIKTVKFDQDIYSMVQVLSLLDLAYMLENFDVPYEQFPFDYIKPSIKKENDNELIGNMNKLNSDEKKNAELLANISKTKENIKCVKKKKMDKIKKKEALKRLSAMLKGLKTKQKKNIHEYKITKSIVSKYMKDKAKRKDYYDNKYILERIRDSISHGRVYVIPNERLANSIVKFEDYDGDQLVFSADVVLKDLVLIVDRCKKLLLDEKIKLRKK